MLSAYSHNEFDPKNENTTWFKMVNMVPAKSRVLDIGCSTGTLGAVLREEKQAYVIGIDITASDVEIAKSNLDKAFVWDVENQPITSSYFGKELYDVIIFADVLEHMKDPIKVLQKVKKLLAKDGRLIFSIPNMAHMFVRLQLLEGHFRYTETGLLDHTHLHFYDEDEVNRIFHNANYNIRTFDCTTFDYPDSLLAEKLSNVGLTLTLEFSKLAHSKQAIFFEYVGWAQPNANRKTPAAVPIDSTSPLDDVLAYVQRIKDADESIIKSLQLKVELTTSHTNKLEVLNEELRQSLANFQVTLPPRRSSVIRTAAKKVLKKRSN